MAEEGCPLVSPLIEDVKRLVLADEIPVIIVVEKSDGIVTFEVRSASETPFVAISHVWADGLGSTTEQGLPTCQLRRLASLVHGMSPGSAFWTDGLCIPDIRSVQKKAIGMMARIYSEALGVLVLDGGLQLCPSAEPTGAKMLHVLTCGWMRRLWTLQEAVLAKDLLFVFCDGRIEMKDLIPPMSEMLATSGVDAVVSPRGLTAIYYAIIFPETTCTDGKIWIVKDGKAEMLYEVTTITDTKGSYTCDMLLLLEPLPFGGAAPCVAVKKTGQSKEEDGRFTVYCDYERRMIINSVVSKQNTPAYEMVEASLSGRLTVCVG
ncbi:hypothetical protein PT974_07324 [Cladobotryum mycophilum]|uniref:Heterokaryon incompatibility domain-containing protein n=1 Tax=Cladobotryum mycophilum TaxID=491253 RepID=A0ABR0SPR5_9HYPO